MTARKSVAWGAAAGLAVTIALRASAAGQGPSTNQDALGALLTEVHGLRVAMEQMASAGPRVQLAIGRLQLQEQRVNTLIRRADEIQASVLKAQKEGIELQQGIERSQHALERGTLQADERSQLEAILPFEKQQLARKNAEIQRLQTEEADAATQVANEQARWVEINQRLEELERALIKR